MSSCMSNNAPIDEYYFWKVIIDRKKETGEIVPEIMYELLDQAKKKTMYDLMDKYSMGKDSTDDNPIDKKPWLQ